MPQLFNYHHQVCASFSNLDTESLTISNGLAIPTNIQYCSISKDHNFKPAGLPSNFASRSSLTVLAVNVD